MKHKISNVDLNLIRIIMSPWCHGLESREEAEEQISTLKLLNSPALSTVTFVMVAAKAAADDN